MRRLAPLAPALKLEYCPPITNNQSVFAYFIFTRRELVKQIAALYARIYREEEETTTRPMTETGCLNRGQSFGRYGIYLHDIDDLLLHTVIRRADGKYELGIDS